MLSHIVSLIRTYETDHGVKPNLIYMNETHYLYLREELPGVRDHDEVTNIIGADIALNETTICPQVVSAAFSDENILAS